MTHDERPAQEAKPTTRRRNWRELSLEVEPGRDLWPGIAARLEQQARAAAASVTRRPAWAWQAAAALVLVAGSSLLTASLLDGARRLAAGCRASCAGARDRDVGAGVGMPRRVRPDGQAGQRIPGGPGGS